MGNYDRIELQGEQRQRALADIAAQLDAWGLTMPDVTPIPAHFGLNRFPEVGETEFWIVNDEEHGYCGKFLFVFDGQTCPYHHHEVKHETFFVVKGAVRMRVGDEERTLEQGDFLAMPPGTDHAFTCLTGHSHQVPVESPVVDDMIGSELQRVGVLHRCGY